MKVIDYLRGCLTKKKTIEISADELEDCIDKNEMRELCIQEFFILVATSLLANILASCEFKTIKKNKEKREDEYYLWNYEPNQNESGAEFKKKLVDVLIRKNECLIVELFGKLYIADSYTIRETSAFEEAVFEDIVIGNTLAPIGFKMSGVIYLKMNNRNIKTLLDGVTEGYQKVARNALQKYEQRGNERGILKIDATATAARYGEKSFDQIYQELMEKRFKTYFSGKNAVLPMFNGFSYESKSKAAINNGEGTDYINTIDEIAAKTGMAFHISPQLLVGKVEGLADAVTNTLSFAIDPIAKTIESEINRKRFKKAVLKDNYMMIDTSRIMHIDLFDVAEKVDKLIASGMTNIDELRSRAGMLELRTPESTKHFITKNYQEITEVKTKGGEEDGNKTTDGEKEDGTTT